MLERTSSAFVDVLSKRQGILMVEHAGSTICKTQAVKVSGGFSFRNAERQELKEIWSVKLSFDLNGQVHPRNRDIQRNEFLERRRALQVLNSCAVELWLR